MKGNFRGWVELAINRQMPVYLCSCVQYNITGRYSHVSWFLLDVGQPLIMIAQILHSGMVLFLIKIVSEPTTTKKTKNP